MNNFWSLVGFEYKKIFVRKSVIVAIALSLGVVLLSSVTMLLGSNNMSNFQDTKMSNYEEMMMDKENELALSGRALDGELILEASEAYAKIPDDIYPYTDSEEYQKYARPYYFVLPMVDSAYTTRNEPFGYADFQIISEDLANSYYEKRAEQYRLNLENNPLFTQENVEVVMELDTKVEKPIVIQYDEGYTRFLALSTSNALLIMILLAFIISPMFSEEYQKRTDSLILSSKYGKNKQILAKLFTGVSIGVIITFMLMLAGYLACMLAYGFEGTNAAIQNYVGLSTYNFTMLDVVVLLFITTTFGSFLMVAISLFLSSAISKPIAALAISMVIAILGIINGVALPGFEKVRYFLPTALGTFWDVTVQFSWSIFGINIMLYQAVCMVAFVIGTGLLLLTYGNFKKHQAQ